MRLLCKDDMQGCQRLIGSVCRRNPGDYFLFRGPSKYIDPDLNFAGAAIGQPGETRRARFVMHFDIPVLKSKQIGMHHRQRR